MKTTLLYLHDSYQKTATAKVVDVISEGTQTSVILDRTIFYAQGGGQPADQGVIHGEKGVFSVSHVSYNGGAILHKGKLSGELRLGDEVELQIDWKRRYQHMQQHTAGHMLDQAVKNVVKHTKGIDGNHGISKELSVDFDGKISEDQLPAIQYELERMVSANLPITAEMISYDEMMKRKISLPFDLPQNKELRIVQIGKYPAMPDGGTQLQSTGESWPITVVRVQELDGKWRVVYAVQSPLSEKKNPAPPAAVTNTAGIANLQKKIQEIKDELASDTLVGDELQTKYLGKKGMFNQLAQVLKNLSPEEKRGAGQFLNELRTHLETEVANKKTQQKTAWVDLTMPGVPPKVGHMHPVSQAMEEITRIFEQIGFTRVRYPEVDWDHYVFEALNMPPDHPARDEWETFFMDMPIDKKMGKVVLTTHTSNGQVREMERLHSKPPMRMINIARCYRRQQDATHLQMFHQFEGLVVDKGITIQHLKGTLDYFAEQFYGPGTKSRIRPFHFQFTEPSFEVDFSCHICHGTGKITDADGQLTRCKFCKGGWHEVGGAGMVHPNVLKAGGIDPEEYTGFAFGWGVERTYTLKEGLNIDDIRLLYGGDLRFLEQF